MGPKDIWAALGGYLFLLGLLRCVPGTLAQGTWEYILTNDQYRPALLVMTITVASAPLIRAYLSKMMEPIPAIEKKHDQDVNAFAFIRNRLLDTDIVNPLKNGETIFDTAKRLTQRYLVQVKEGIPNRQKIDDMLRGMNFALLSIKHLQEQLGEAGDVINTLNATKLELADDNEKLRKQIQEKQDTIDNLASSQALSSGKENLDDWENMILQVFPQLDDLTPIYVRWHLEALKQRADYEPIFSLFSPTDARTRDAVKTSTDLAHYVQQAASTELRTLYALLPEEVKTPGENLLEDFRAALRQIKNSTKRLTTRFTQLPRMSIDTTPSQGDPLPEIAAAIPPEHQPPTNTKESILESLRNWRQQLPTTILRTPTMENLGCRHPRELVDTLAMDPATTWPEALAEVTRLAHAPPAPIGITPEAPVWAIEPTHVFRASDVPPFDDPDNYWTWRATFKRFALAETVSDNACVTAIARVLGRFQGKAADLARSWNINDIVMPTWRQTLNSFFQYADMRLLHANFFENQIRKWRGMRPSPSQTAQEFLREFESQFLLINAVAETTNRPRLSDGEMIRQAVAVLPAGVRNLLRFQQTNPDLLSPKDFFDTTVRAWDFTREEEQRQNRTQNKAAPARELKSYDAPAKVTGSPFSLPCNKPCWDTQPAVPNHLRGKIRNQYNQVIEQYKGLCFQCRRPAEEHGGPQTGCRTRGNHMFHIPTPARSGQPSGNDQGTQ